MRRTTGALLALPLALAAVLPAQKGEPPKRSTADTEYEKLTAEHAAATATLRAAMQELSKTDAYKKAVEARDREAMAALRKDLPTVDAAAFGERFLQAAEGLTGEERVPFLCWAALNSNSKELTGRAVDDLLEQHAKSPRLLELLEGYFGLVRGLGPDKTQEVLSRLQADSPHAQVRAWAMYAQASLLQRNRSATEADKAKAEELLAQAEQLAAGSELADRIAAPRFQKERLQIGMKAPDIVGEDVDGTPFKLSDYLGKVVVLDFWGFW